MSYRESLTKYIANFVNQLYVSGVRNVVISPGSRSTPLSLTFAEYDRFQLWVDIDERSAAFFALGMAKETREPVVLVCTSGTAAANYYPAIIEAHYSRIPLIVLTADRPHELREVGAPQTINQLKIFGDYPKWFHEMALPSATVEMLRYARNQAKRAIQTALRPNCGVVHLNFPLREPLVPDFTLQDIWGEEEKSLTLRAVSQLSQPNVELLIDKLKNKKRGILVCGPQDRTELGSAIVDLAEAWGIPIFADPLSLLRNGKHSNKWIVEGYDAILKSKAVRDLLELDFIIRFGAMPVSKAYLQLLQEKQGIEHIVVEEGEGYREPVGVPTHFLNHCDGVHLCRDLASYPIKIDEKWSANWRKWNTYTKEVLMEKQDRLTEGLAVIGIQQTIPDHTVLFASNSMPIRDVDTFWFSNQQLVKVLANRGANGIDGIISTALGISATDKHTTLLIGDVSFLHSLNGLLLAKNYRLNLTIVLINNNGGGIFSFLPQAKDKSKHYELLFGTPQDIDIQKLAAAYDASYEKPENWTNYVRALENSYQRGGLTIVEVETDRTENVSWHQQKWDLIKQYLLHELEGTDDVL